MTTPNKRNFSGMATIISTTVGGGGWDDADSVNDNDSHGSLSWPHEPIVVAYAFGAKKMKSMGMVMAEASRVPVIHEEEEELFYYTAASAADGEGEGEGDDNAATTTEARDPSQKGFTSTTSSSSGSSSGSSSSSAATPARDHHHRHRHRHLNGAVTLTSAALKDLEPEDAQQPPTSTIISYGTANDTNLKHIVRYFRSSCSSAGSMSETTVSTPNTTTTNTNTNTTTTTFSSSKHGQIPVRISFVPVDPDIPLEEQHGGHFDLILHKLTEDILTCSLSPNNTNTSTSTAITDSNEEEGQHGTNPNSHTAAETQASYNRVHALIRYQQVIHPSCCLVDDPMHVQTLMSRSDIAQVLHQCLKGVYSASGIPVAAPKFVVVDQSPEGDPQRLAELQQQLDSNGLTAPWIVKPLVAAGTKESHYMTIVLHSNALAKVPPRSIIQEYVNHDATLYKVYVLGEHVYVYQRPSLPNLPHPLPATTTTTTNVDVLEFDSQRPYPRLSDFGLVDDDDSSSYWTDGNEHTTTTSPSPSSSANALVTPDEVRPIVERIRQAFGLELFGFDILLEPHQQQCLVVDVNYFPSYKEVPNFPTLLAHYLTQRVLTQRRRTQPHMQPPHMQPPHMQPPHMQPPHMQPHEPQAQQG